MKPKQKKMQYCNKFSKDLRNNKIDPDQAEASIPCSFPPYPWALGQYCSSFSHSGTTFTNFALSFKPYYFYFWNVTSLPRLFWKNSIYCCQYIIMTLSLFRLCCSVAQSCPTLCYPMDCSTPGRLLWPLLSLSLLRFVFIELVMLSNHLILCWPLLLLPLIFPSISILTTSYIFPITLKIKTNKQAKKAATAFYLLNGGA